MTFRYEAFCDPERNLVIREREGLIHRIKISVPLRERCGLGTVYADEADLGEMLCLLGVARDLLAWNSEPAGRRLDEATPPSIWADTVEDLSRQLETTRARLALETEGLMRDYGIESDESVRDIVERLATSDSCRAAFWRRAYDGAREEVAVLRALDAWRVAKDSLADLHHQPRGASNAATIRPSRTGRLSTIADVEQANASMLDDIAEAKREVLEIVAKAATIDGCVPSMNLFAARLREKA